jgi:hypothetical protein
MSGGLILYVAIALLIHQLAMLWWEERERARERRNLERRGAWPPWSVQPVRVVSSRPTIGLIGELVFWTGDHSLYRADNNGVFMKAYPEFAYQPEPRCSNLREGAVTVSNIRPGDIDTVAIIARARHRAEFAAAFDKSVLAKTIDELCYALDQRTFGGPQQ